MNGPCRAVPRTRGKITTCAQAKRCGTVRSGVMAAPRPLEPWSIGSNPMGGTAVRGAFSKMTFGAGTALGRAGTAHASVI